MDIVQNVSSVLAVCLALADRIIHKADQISYHNDLQKEVRREIQTVRDTLELLQGLDGLQTRAIGESVRGVIKILDQLDKLHNKSDEGSRGTHEKIRRYLKSKDSISQQQHVTSTLLQQLGLAQQNLHLRIAAVQVGITGDAKNGFFISPEEVQSVNKKVHRCIGVDLKVMVLLEGRSPRSDGKIEIPVEEKKSMDEYAEDVVQAKQPGESSTHFVDGNHGEGQWEVVTGNVGVGPDYKQSPRHTTVTNNRFNNGGRIVTGDLGGEAAANFYTNFWK